jgi:Response regulators consisting of a CheY-like receiver domain and a winged-helix DNA-binding domain
MDRNVFVMMHWRMQMNGPDILLKQEAVLLNDLYIDPIGYQVKLGKTELDLTLKEFELLYLLVCNRGKVVRRSEILKVVATGGKVDQAKAINIMICRLRKKIEVNPHRPKRIITVSRLGYKLREQNT